MFACKTASFVVVFSLGEESAKSEDFIWCFLLYFWDYLKATCRKLTAALIDVVINTGIAMAW